MARTEVRRNDLELLDLKDASYCIFRYSLSFFPNKVFCNSGFDGSSDACYLVGYDGLYRIFEICKL